MNDLQPIRQRHIALMQKTLDILTNMLRDVDQSTATTLRDLSDGDKGWTTLEVLCHLRDFDGYFRGRAVMMAMQEHPDLPAYDHEALAIEGRYNEQNLQLVLDELVASRRETIDFFEELSGAQWERTGVHPERGDFAMTDAVMQVGLHDVVHIEQIVRILGQVKEEDF